MCSISGLERSQVWSETERRARKAHDCDCCGGRIKPGETYIKHFSVYDGIATSEKVCMPCHEARDEFCLKHNFVGIPSRFGFDLQDCVGEATHRIYDKETRRWRKSREFWRDDDRRWRSILAGMIRRDRAARRDDRAQVAA